MKFNSLILELTVSDIESLYSLMLSNEIKPFRELTVNRYRNGAEMIVQKKFLMQDPDGYLLRLRTDKM